MGFLATRSPPLHAPAAGTAGGVPASSGALPAGCGRARGPGGEARRRRATLPPQAAAAVRPRGPTRGRTEPLCGHRLRLREPAGPGSVAARSISTQSRGLGKSLWGRSGRTSARPRSSDPSWPVAQGRAVSYPQASRGAGRKTSERLLPRPSRERRPALGAAPAGLCSIAWARIVCQTLCSARGGRQRGCGGAPGATSGRSKYSAA